MSEVTVDLPADLGGPLRLREAGLDALERELGGASSPRVTFAAAHVVMKESYRDTSHSLEAPGPPDEIAEAIDWSATADLRRRLDACGHGIAEAMDTAQRFFIGWENARRLIDLTGELGLTNGFAAGAGADGVPDDDPWTAVVERVVEQGRHIAGAGGWTVLLPLPWLTRGGHDEETYRRVYRAIIDELDGPILLHWLGEMFLPELQGYFPGETFAEVMAHDPEKVRGAKISLLDAAREVEIRHELAPAGQIILTGDDFDFASLMQGEGEPTGAVDIGGRRVLTGDFSHGLLGILDAVARPAGVALKALGAGREATYHELMDPLEVLSRTIFEAPTQHYKAGLAFLAWINGDQPNAMLVNREDLARSKQHLVEVLRLAGDAAILDDVHGAAERIAAWAAT